VMVLGAIALWAAMGGPGNNALTRRLSRLDLERDVTLTDSGVRITRGTRTWDRGWEHYGSAFETEDVLVLKRETGLRFLTIPPARVDAR